MKFICLGHIDPDKFASNSEAEVNAMMDSCIAYDEQLRANGHFAGGEALQPPNTAKTLRYANGRVVVTDGPFAETKEQLGGILILEAHDLNHAVELLSNFRSSKTNRFGTLVSLLLASQLARLKLNEPSGTAIRTPPGS